MAINFGQIAGAWQERNDWYGGQRKDMARAFAEYKAANPLATQADFQNFIDSFSGGNNYIAGGAPAKDTLARIAASNQAKENERLRGVAFEDLKRKQEATNLFRDEISKRLLGMTPSSIRGGPEAGAEFYDFGAEYQNFLAENPDLEKLGIDMRDMFSDENRRQLISDSTIANQGKGMDYLNSIGGDVENINVADFARIYGLAMPVAKSILEAVSYTHLTLPTKA